jgi:(2Fe-2S) ferredoxin
VEIELRDIDAMVEEAGKQAGICHSHSAGHPGEVQLPARRSIAQGVRDFRDHGGTDRGRGQFLFPVQVYTCRGAYDQGLCGHRLPCEGAVQVYDAMKRELGLEENEDTTASGSYTIEKVNCLGCCTLAPVVQIDQVTYGHVSTAQVGSIVKDFESQKGGSREKKFRLADGSEVKGEIRIGLGSCCVASGKR